MEKNPTKSRNRRIRNGILYFLFLFIIQEIVVRYSYPIPEFSNFDRVQYSSLAGSDDNAEFLRNKTWYWTSAPDTNTEFDHFMNQYGFRDKEWIRQKPEKKQRVLFIGDSFVEGVMSDQDGTIPSGFIQGAEKKYDVMNAGILGVGMNSYLQLLTDILPVYRPDQLVICIYSNDLLAETPPLIPTIRRDFKHYAPLRPRIFEFFNQRKNHGNLLPAWHSVRVPFLAATPAITNPFSTNEDILAPQVSKELIPLMKNGTFNAYRTGALLKEAEGLLRTPQLGDAIEYIQELCNEYEVKPVIVYVPSRNQVTDYYLPFERKYCLQCSDTLKLSGPEFQTHQNYLGTKCMQNGIPFIDLTPNIRKEESKQHHLYWNYDEHMRRSGYLLLGRTIREKIEQPESN